MVTSCTSDLGKCLGTTKIQLESRDGSVVQNGIVALFSPKDTKATGQDNGAQGDEQKTTTFHDDGADATVLHVLLTNGSIVFHGR